MKDHRFFIYFFFILNPPLYFLLEIRSNSLILLQGVGIDENVKTRKDAVLYLWNIHNR